MTNIKICGISTIRHALVAAEAGAEMIGLMFAKSRRQVTPEQALAIRNALTQMPDDQRPRLVGVFVNADADDMLTVADYCGLDMIQLSGDEPPDTAAGIRRYELLKAVRLMGDRVEEDWLQWARSTDSMHLRLLVDAHVVGSYGGTGVVSDWERASLLARRLEIMLAGGLTVENVQDAIQAVQPWAVDVSSGVETNGSKDSDKIRAFIRAVRTV